ncbi:MAG: (Fe-S)-binding protein [Acidobacteriota bacterium]
MEFKQLPPVRDQLRKCVRCGRCRNVCPIFAEIRNETVAPRGHVFMTQMLRDGEVAPDPKVYEKMGNCLLCETCTTFCPSGIDIHELNEAARSYIYSHHPSTVKNLIFDRLWTHPALFRTGGFFAALANKTGLQKAARSIGLTKLLPGDLSKSEQIMHDMPLRNARSQLQVINKAVGQQKARVAYFLGCGTDMFNPSIGIATVKVLTDAGCEVIIPKDMKCCGLPHIANGKMDTARDLALHNLKVFNGLNVDYIVTDCASCSSAISAKRLHLLLDGQSVDGEIERFCSKVRDLTSFLTEVVEYQPQNLNPIKQKVTYHDPCHLAKAQSIRQQPRQLLRTIPGLELVEMKDSDRCCGGSGTFAITHYDLSMKVLDRKMNAIKNTDASIIATCCPSCTMQLKHGVNISNYKAEVKHPVELLASALKQN